MSDHMAAAVIKASQDRILEEAQSQQRAARLTPARGRHRKPHPPSAFGRAATTRIVTAGRRALAAAGRAMREMAAFEATDPGLPRLHGYPVSRGGGGTAGEASRC